MKRLLCQVFGHRWSIVRVHPFAAARVLCGSLDGADATCARCGVERLGYEEYSRVVRMGQELARAFKGASQ